MFARHAGDSYGKSAFLEAILPAYRDLWLSESSLDTYADSHSFPIDAMRQKLASSLRDGSFHSRARCRIDEQGHASASSRAADFAGQRTLASRSSNNTVNHRCGNRGQIPPAKLPFFPDELAGFLPLVSI